MENQLTREEIAEVLEYFPESGDFRWRVNRGRVKPGEVAGSVDSNGYRLIGVLARTYHAHRLAFLFMTGAMPIGMVDHINGMKDDNRWSNLRDVSNRVNNQNQRKPHKDSKTGILGVTRHQGRYLAAISVNGKRRYIGLFDCPKVAHAAYLAHKRILHPGNML